MIQTPGWFISTMAEMRSAVPSQRTGTRTGFGRGLPSIAITVKVWPGRARLRVSVALPFKTWKSTRRLLLHGPARHGLACDR